jgi:hypothetical protein
VVFGAAWMRWGPASTVHGFTAGMVLAVCLCLVLLRPGTRKAGAR